MIKKILIFIFVVLFLSSCFGGDDNESSSGKPSLLKNFVQTDFNISIPKTWTIIKSNEDIFPKPAFGEIIFDAKSEKSNNNFYRNILILKQKLADKNINSLDYISSNYIGAKKNYFYIKDLKDENVKIDGKKTKLYIFDARYSEDTPIAKYIQTGIICDNYYAYLITLAIEQSNQNIDRYKSILGSFKCKNEAESEIK